MSEDLNASKLLEMLSSAPGLTALQRAILTTDGTVQSMLSVILKGEVTARVISQMDVGGVIVRWTQLVEKEHGWVVCLAESVIPRSDNTSSFIEDIDARELGIGQILAKHKIMTKRTVLGVFCDQDFFTRTYRIQGSVTDIVITEVFPTGVFNEAV